MSIYRVGIVIYKHRMLAAYDYKEPSEPGIFEKKKTKISNYLLVNLFR